MVNPKTPKPQNPLFLIRYHFIQISKMDAESNSKLALAQIRDSNRLLHLRRRPRCANGCLDMRARVNRSFSKDSHVTDYYDPLDPSAVVSLDEILLYQVQQQRDYDDARFQQLHSRIEQLERERSALLKFKASAEKYIIKKRIEIKQLSSKLRSQPQD